VERECGGEVEREFGMRSTLPLPAEGDREGEILHCRRGTALTQSIDNAFPS
jgi:hypothetical protein